MVPFCHFWSLTSPFPVQFHCMEKCSLNIQQNIYLYWTEERDSYKFGRTLGWVHLNVIIKWCQNIFSECSEICASCSGPAAGQPCLCEFFPVLLYIKHWDLFQPTGTLESLDTPHIPSHVPYISKCLCLCLFVHESGGCMNDKW